MIRLTLIIASYNRAAQLLDTLESVVWQDAPRREWECVVVDNNSADDTQVQFAAFAAAHTDCNLRIVCETRQGLSHARNRGIAVARGAYIAIIDDDELIEPQFIRSYIEFFNQNRSALVAGGPIVAEYPAGCPAWMSRYVEIPIANPMNYGEQVRPFPTGKIPGGGNMAFRQVVVDRFGGFDPALGRVGGKLVGGEETDFFDRLRRAGEVVWYVPGAVMHHIIPPSKLTEEYFRRLCRNVGISQRMRARMNGNLGVVRLREFCKWCATLLLCLTMHPRKSLWLLRMRLQISRGLFCRE